MSNAERQALYRLRHGSTKDNRKESPKSVTEHPLPVTEAVTSNVVEESRVEEREGRVTPPLTLVSSEPKPDRVARLWAEQEQLRADAVPGGRALTLTKDRRKLVQAALKAGYSDDDLRATLEAYADEARRNGSLEWFNGETNWRPANIARKLGGIGPSSPSVNHRPMGVY